VLEGHIPNPQDLRRYYNEQFAQAEKAWQKLHPPEDKEGNKS
jgi:hypothetical protein